MSIQRGFWLAAACGALILTLATGLRATFGLFLKPVSIDLGVSREFFGFGFALQNLLWGAASPFLGSIADKYGTGRVVVFGALCYAAGLVVMGYATSGEMIIIGNVLVGVALAGSGFSVVLGAIGRAAPPERRSMALGIITAGGSFGQFAVVPYAHILIEALDWRMALVSLAITALVMLPLIPPVTKVHSVQPAGVPQTLRQALSEAVVHKGFWLLTAGFFVCGFQVVFVATHLPAFLADRGMPTWVGAWTLALVGLFNIVVWLRLARRPLQQEEPAGGGLLAALAGLHPVHDHAAVRVQRATVRCPARPALARHGPAHQRPRRLHLRPGLHVDALWHRFLQPSGRQLPRRLAGRIFLRRVRLLRRDVVDLRGARFHRQSAAFPDRGTTGAAPVGGDRAMNPVLKYSVLGAVILALAGAGWLWGVRGVAIVLDYAFVGCV
jgi:MFS family permease